MGHPGDHHSLRMAQAATVPSPALVMSTPTAPIDVKHAKKTVATPLSGTKSAPKASEASGVTKRKQSKSRNGMLAFLIERLSPARRAER